jgi:hypothetical protein
MGREDVNQTKLAQDRDQWQVLVSTAIKPVDSITGKFFICSMIMNCYKRRS